MAKTGPIVMKRQKPKSWLWTSVPSQACVSAMEDGNRHELIAAIVLEAGRIIEDLTPAMAERLPDSFEARSRLLNDIAQQHQIVSALMQAAFALNGDRSPGKP